MKIVVATRGSPLALWQAREAERLLRAARSDLEVAISIVASTGDRDDRTDLASFGRTGLFTAEIDRAVLQGEADLGVHSLKDMTTTLEAGLALGGVLARGPAEDALLSRDGTKLASLPPGSRVATGSARRTAMLRRARPDLEVVAIRGNVDTRVAKLLRGDVDALVLARAGLERLGLGARIAFLLDPREFVPEAGQGAIAVQVRAGEEVLVAALDHAPSRAAVEAERECVRRLGGGCTAAVAAHAWHEGGELRLQHWTAA